MSEKPKDLINAGDFSAWRNTQTDYTVEYYYIQTPGYVRLIEPCAAWLKSFAEGALAWCKGRKIRITWPDGQWGPDVGSK
jgi:hypothetical protein